MKPKEHEGVSSHGSSADGLPAIPERVLLFDPVRIEKLITALLGEYGTEYTLTLALASDLADHRQLGQAANGFRDAVDVCAAAHGHRPGTRANPRIRAPHGRDRRDHRRHPRQQQGRTVITAPCAISMWRAYELNKWMEWTR